MTNVLQGSQMFSGHLWTCKTILKTVLRHKGSKNSWKQLRAWSKHLRVFSDTAHTNYKHMEPQKLTNVIQTSQNSPWLSLRFLNKWYGVFAPQCCKFSHWLPLQKGAAAEKGQEFENFLERNGGQVLDAVAACASSIAAKWNDCKSIS